MIDSHCHMESRQYGGDVSAVIQRARDVGVSVIVNIGTDLATSLASIALAERYPEVYATAGFHPHDAKNFDAASSMEIAALVRHPRVVALGEIGLDYYRDNSPRTKQQAVFREQLEIALRENKPVVIHDREAFADTFAIASEYADRIKGVFHCFSGNVQQAKQVFDMGWIISVGGVVTYKNSSMADVAAYAPLDKMMLETDAPYLTPVPHRGELNQPAYVRHVCECVARIKKLSPGEVERVTDTTARRFYRLEERFDE